MHTVTIDGIDNKVIDGNTAVKLFLLLKMVMYLRDGIVIQNIIINLISMSQLEAILQFIQNG